MFYSRRINEETQKVEVWECEWSNKGTGMAKKEYLRKVGDEDAIDFSYDDYNAADAVCWAPGRTIGNIAVSSEETFGMFEGNSGNDAVLPCQIIPAGKFRNGASRWYCKTHQIHWGTKADYASASESGEVKCSNHLTKMSYVINPLEIEFKDFEEIGIWCSLPPGLSSEVIEPRAPVTAQLGTRDCCSCRLVIGSRPSCQTKCHPQELVRKIGPRHQWRFAH